jgi:hypothetical protein
MGCLPVGCSAALLPGGWVRVEVAARPTRRHGGAAMATTSSTSSAAYFPPSRSPGRPRGIDGIGIQNARLSVTPHHRASHASYGADVKPAPASALVRAGVRRSLLRVMRHARHANVAMPAVGSCRKHPSLGAAGGGAGATERSEP